MPFLIWQDNYSVNNEVIDSQHKKLFALYNRLYISHLNRESEEAFEVLIDELIAYRDYHSVVDQHFLLESGKKTILKFIREHKTFIRKIQEVTYCLENNKYELLAEQIIEIKKLILNHVAENGHKTPPARW
jgi:hemerythrin